MTEVAGFEAVRGEWWLSDQPDVVRAGTLSRHNENWRLELVGRLSDASRGQSFPKTLTMVPSVTIHGACRGVTYTLEPSYLTNWRGPALRPAAPRQENPQGPLQFTEEWHSYGMIRGAHVDASTHFKWAAFAVTHASTWWRESGMQPSFDPNQDAKYVRPDPLVAEWNNFRVSMFIGHWFSEHQRSSSRREKVLFEVTHANGFTQEELYQKVSHPLRALLAFAFGRDAEIHDMRLSISGADASGTLDLAEIEVDPDIDQNWDEIESESARDALFTADYVDFTNFLPAWFDVCQTAHHSLDFAENRSTFHTYLEVQVLTVLSALESFHASVHPEVQPRLALSVKDLDERLKQLKLNSKERGIIRHAVTVENNSTSLERRLKQILADLGDDFGQWYLSNQAGSWCYVTSQVRNLLAHGGVSPSGAHCDNALLIGILRTALQILQLSYLAHAGVAKGEALQKLVADNMRARFMLNQQVANWEDWAHKIQEARDRPTEESP